MLADEAAHLAHLEAEQAEDDVAGIMGHMVRVVFYPNIALLAGHMVRVCMTISCPPGGAHGEGLHDHKLPCWRGTW